ncbi:methyl-accepting chemotaxis protein [Denitrobaculum tricleocarpae]|uniref:HAMP domain-containing protein n=1 Tax=Denitrobaculum tricleocarpae TaxID=2591009 RepID=A0A545TEL8_9PROT|nr:methyl-accepting chemotaxis protein [Denitrobaculum tricleocarpae]TQV75664.1 HAMP domain-containing protein [Denitrobaculum tricleocarpae]
MKIKTRLILGFSSVILLMIGLTVIAITQVNQINRALHEINEVNSVKQRYAINFRGSVHDRAILVRDVTLLPDPAELPAVLGEIDQLAADYATAAQNMDALFEAQMEMGDEERRILESIKEIEATTLPLFAQIISLQQAGQGEEARRILMEQARPASVTWLARINEFIDLEEAKNQMVGADVDMIASRFAILMLLLAAAATVISLGFVWWAIRSIMPLRNLTCDMLKLAEGDLSVEIPPVRSRDEVGEITKAVLVFRDNALEFKRLEEEQKAREARQASERREEMTRMADEFDQRVGSVVSAVERAAVDMQGLASGLSETMAQTTSRSAAMDSVSKEASGSVQTAAQATEALSASIREISSNVADTAETAKACALSAETSQSKLTDLQSAVDEIDGVIKSINDVAEQTNLLALNATIEAARAGEAGKGFAVVATEVKSLAGQTHKMTEEISQKVADVKSSAEATAGSVLDILGRIQSVDEKTASVSTAIEQQDASTQEINDNIQAASNGTKEVSRNIDSVRSAAEDSSASAETMKSAADGLSVQAVNLKQAVDTFLSEVREG